ncbi:MAG: 30S ribosome-binding factor RbfA [Gaiellales bacterium]
MNRPPVSERLRRVNEALRQVLADGIEGLSDPGLGFVTVTAVRAASDLTQATVYVSVLGNERKRDGALAALERARGLLQARVARELHFKRTPLLTFRYDETTDRALRLNELIDQAAPKVSADPE